MSKVLKILESKFQVGTRVKILNLITPSNRGMGTQRKIKDTGTITQVGSDRTSGKFPLNPHEGWKEGDIWYTIKIDDRGSIIVHEDDLETI